MVMSSLVRSSCAQRMVLTCVCTWGGTGRRAFPMYSSIFPSPVVGRERLCHFGHVSLGTKGIVTVSSAWRVDGMAFDDDGQHRHRQETSEGRERRLSKAKGAVLRYIGRRSHSRKELEKKMLDRGHETDVIQEALDRMQEIGLQDDAEYAAIFARSKWRQSKWSPRKIQMELRRKGVEEESIDDALESVFGVEKAIHVDGHASSLEPKESCDQEAAELVAAAQRQYQSYSGAKISEDAKRRRLIGWLQRRGFSWETVRAVLQQIH